MSDIVERLREVTSQTLTSECHQAADENERLRRKIDQISDEKRQAVNLMQAEIERLRAELAEYTMAVQKRDTEIERLRGLLRECGRALVWQGHDGSCLDQSYNDYDPDCPECRLLMCVRDALGDD